jgi:hypothetical protein
MSCTSETCTCHVDPDTEHAHGELLDHFDVCKGCPASQQKSDLCPTGLVLYELLVKAYRARFERLRAERLRNTP